MIRKVSHKPFDVWLKAQNKTRHRLQPMSGTKDDLLRIVSKVYFKTKPTLRQRLWGWLR
ncbi:hypothetical protein ACT543_03700 [Lactiplantibacillus plantarum]|uniref:hypothetical protein n=1 Tax=Lactiplantibacillus plantarum TaxID=1590 RepID=UPI004035F89F